MNELINNEERSRAIKTAYFQIYKVAKALIASIPQEPLRDILERKCTEPTVIGTIHELISPVLYLRLERHQNERLSIHFGFCQCELASKLYPITSAFVRSIYKLTMAKPDMINIEDSVRTDWVITHTAELFEYLAGRSEQYDYKVVKYRGKGASNKRLLSVA